MSAIQVLRSSSQNSLKYQHNWLKYIAPHPFFVHKNERVWGLSCEGIRVTSRIGAKALNFVRDKTGSVTVEFVIALPILFAILAFCVQYGNALKVRNNLDVASRDAARYLARAPLNSAATDVDVYFKNKARKIVDDRVEKTKSTITSFSPVSDATSASVSVTIDVPFPLLRWIGLFQTENPSLSMSSSESWARTGDGITTTSSSGGS